MKAGSFSALLKTTEEEGQEEEEVTASHAAAKEISLAFARTQLPLHIERQTNKKDTEGFCNP